MSEGSGAGMGEVVMSSGHHYFIKKKKKIPATSSFPDESGLGSPIQMPPYPNPDFSYSVPNFPFFVPFESWKTNPRASLKITLGSSHLAPGVSSPRLLRVLTTRE